MLVSAPRAKLNGIKQGAVFICQNNNQNKCVQKDIEVPTNGNFLLRETPITYDVEKKYACIKCFVDQQILKLGIYIMTFNN